MVCFSIKAFAALIDISDSYSSLQEDLEARGHACLAASLLGLRRLPSIAAQLALGPAKVLLGAGSKHGPCRLHYTSKRLGIWIRLCRALSAGVFMWWKV